MISLAAVLVLRVGEQLEAQLLGRARLAAVGDLHEGVVVDRGHGLGSSSVMGT